MTSPSRRDFFEVAGALVIGFSTAACSSRSRRDFRPNAWLRIAPDDQITVFVEIPEMGQGARTVDTIMLAEELEADWRSIRVEQAPVQPAVYKKLSTGGSGGVANMWDDLPRAGAQAREMLITAAAQNWRVPRNECRAEGGAVIHQPTGRRLRYGELAAAAAALPAIPASRIRLKNAAEYRLVGKTAPSVDIPSKVDGSAVFGIDVRVPGMLFATIAQCPHFGGSLKSFDASAAKAMPGVRAVFAVAPIGFVPKLKTNVNSAGGVAVVADSTWAAIQARKALRLEWNPGPDAGETTAGLADLLRQAAGGPASFVAVNEGDVDEALGRSHRKIEAYYEMPFQAHATMEPMNTTVHVRKDGIEVWSPTQIGAKAQEEIAILSGLPPERITVHMMLCGGSFGRRYQWDYIAQAWQVAKEVPAPVQLLWTREDDLQHDFYRQSTFHQMAGGVDDRGSITAWKHRVASTSIRATFGSAEQLKDPKRVASQELGGADVLPYAAASRRLDYAPAHSAVPRAWWRSVESSFNGFALECFVDELAHLAGRDPYRFRMDLLDGDRRLNAVMWPGGRPLETARLRARAPGGGGEIGMGHAAGSALRPRHRLFLFVRDLYGVCGGGVRGARRRGPRAPPDGGGGLRAGSEPERCPGDDPGRREFRADPGADRRNHGSRCGGGAGQFPPVPSAADGPGAGGGRAHSERRLGAGRNGGSRCSGAGAGGCQRGIRRYRKKGAPAAHRSAATGSVIRYAGSRRE